MFVFKTILKIIKKQTIIFKVFLKTQRLCTISKRNVNVTTLYTQNNEFKRLKLMCQDLWKAVSLDATANLHHGEESLSFTLK